MKQQNAVHARKFFFWKLHLKYFGFVEELGDPGGQLALYVVAALMFTANKHENVWSDSVSPCTHSCSRSLSQLYRNSGHLSEIGLGYQVV